MAGSPSRSIPRTTPARKGKAATSRKATKPSLLGRVIARPGIIVAGATFAAVMTGIVVNAVMFQKGHHPSPLFAAPPAQTAGAEPLERVVSPTPVPVRVPREVLDTPARPAAPAESPAPPPAAPLMLHPDHPVTKTAVHSVAPPHKVVAAKPHHDLIGQLLGKTPKGE